MKGVIFTSFVEMLEQDFGMEFADQILTTAELESGGAYTAVGNYPHSELLNMVQKIGEITGKSIPDLMNHFGRFMLGYFQENYPHFFKDIHNSFDLLKTVDNVIHVEVKKLYPDAQLPKFTHRFSSPNEMEFVYQSPRKLADFACGLIDQIIKHFGENIEVRQEKLEESGAIVKFVLKKIV